MAISHGRKEDSYMKVFSHSETLKKHTLFWYFSKQLKIHKNSPALQFFETPEYLKVSDLNLPNRSGRSPCRLR